MSNGDPVQNALVELDKAARAFRTAQGQFSLETQGDLARNLAGLDIDDYVSGFVHVTDAYKTGADLPADAAIARSLIPPGTGALRDFSYVGPELPVFEATNCVACMECVTECPDTAILAKVLTEETIADDLRRRDRPEPLRSHWAETRKFHKGFAKAEEGPGLFGIFIDPTKCKGCAECVDVCGDHDALRMVAKTQPVMEEAARSMEHFSALPDTEERFVRDRIAIDRMLACEKTHLYVGGAGSCAGCGEASALRMLMAQVGWEKGRNGVAIVAATGCNTVYSSTYPYNPFVVPWTNSLFENAPAVAMGVRKRWDQKGWADKALWVLGGDGAMFDIGFGSLSRMLSSGLDINVLVLDTQVYSNTGGQASTASFQAQTAKMAPFGREKKGKLEARKDLVAIAMMHPNVFVAQTTAAHANHFYRAVSAAMAHGGPSLLVVYTSCQPEHGIADHASAEQARLAVESRAFPLLVHDPARGESLHERLDLQGNPSLDEDWHSAKDGTTVDFVSFARTEGRFEKHFDREGRPSPELLAGQEQVLQSWRRLRELAGLS